MDKCAFEVLEGSSKTCNIIWYCTWTVKKVEEKKLDLVKMRMLRWMHGASKLDMIRNERIRGTMVSNKM